MSSRTRSLSHPRVLLALLLTVACQPVPSSEPAPSANELAGVWSLTADDPGDGSPVIEPSQPGLYIFTDGYYSAVYPRGSDPRIKSEVSFQPTQEEMVAQYETIIVNTGTYEINGSMVTFRPIIAKSPGFVGGHQTSSFRVDGDTLVLTLETVVAVDGVSAPNANVSGSLTFVRVE